MSDLNPIRAYRAKSGFTLHELATQIGVQRNTIWRWEQGRAPDKKVWPAIIKATPITRQQLLRFAMATKYAARAATWLSKKASEGVDKLERKKAKLEKMKLAIAAIEAELASAK